MQHRNQQVVVDPGLALEFHQAADLTPTLLTLQSQDTIEHQESAYHRT